MRSPAFQKLGASLFRAALLLMLVSSGCKCEDAIRGAVDKDPNKRRIDKHTTKDPQTAEQEPNNAPEVATPILLGNELRPLPATVADASDVDWYEVATSAEEPQLFTVVVEPSESLNPSIHLQIPGHEGLPVAYDIGGKGEPESVVAMRLGKTPIRMAVRGEEGTTGDYKIIFTKRMAGGSVEWEPNDMPSVAVDLELPGQIEGFVDRPSDRDVFAIKRGEGDEQPVVSFEYRPVVNLPQVIRFFGAEDLREPLMSLQVAGQKNQKVAVPNFRIPDGIDTLWMVLTAPDGFDRKSAYMLSFRPVPSVADDVELEPNDTHPQPLPMPAKLRGILHSPDDTDHFALGVLEAQKEADMGNDAGIVPKAIEAQADMGGDAGLPPEGPAPIALPEKTRAGEYFILRAKALRKGVKIGGTLSGPSGERRIEPQLDGSVELCDTLYRPGEHEFWVHPLEVPKGPDGEFDYSVSLDSTAQLEGFEIEPNNEKASADALTAVQRGFLTSKDVDVWAFAQDIAPDTFGPVTVELTGKYPMRVRVLDAEGGLVLDVPQPSATHEIALDLPRGMYLVEVQLGSGVGGCDPYEIKLKSVK